MTNLKGIFLEKKPERAILIGIDLHNHHPILSMADSLEELKLLAKTAGVEVVGEITQRLDTPNPSTFIGSGKVEELKILVDELDAEMVIFDESFTRHQRELEEILGNDIKVLDRTALILDVFAQHAHTKEGILQVGLAQYEYRLPRLTRAWTHLARQAGGGAGRTGSVGGVGLRGPGETQLEVDRREIRSKISKSKDELEKVHEQRSRYRAQRKKTQIPIISLVGYTNAGKSTLMNTLSGAGVYQADQLFATLDPVTRKLELANGQHVLLTDTVGFIQKLPTQLVASFRATLEEISEADLLIHVVDVTHINASAQAKSVVATLKDIDAGDIPIITALNKIDKLHDPASAIANLEAFPNTFAISALTGQGISDLLNAISRELFEAYAHIKVLLPYNQGHLLSQFHDVGHVLQMSHEEAGIIVDGMLPKRYLPQYEKFTIKKKTQAEQ